MEFPSQKPCGIGGLAFPGTKYMHVSGNEAHRSIDFSEGGGQAEIDPSLTDSL